MNSSPLHGRRALGSGSRANHALLGLAILAAGILQTSRASSPVHPRDAAEPSAPRRVEGARRPHDPDSVDARSLRLRSLASEIQRELAAEWVEVLSPV
jgi:hypothetical protein